MELSTASNRSLIEEIAVVHLTCENFALFKGFASQSHLTSYHNTTLIQTIEDGGLEESEAVEDAAERADLTEISAALLVRLRDIHTALDSVSLKRADVGPKRVMLAEAARKLQIGSNEDSQP
jgi:hypothetical protein